MEKSKWYLTQVLENMHLVDIVSQDFNYEQQPTDPQHN